MNRKALPMFCYAIFLLGALSLTQIPKPPIQGITTNISGDNQEVVLEALRKFDPATRRYLASLPIVYGDVRTAEALTTAQVPPGKEKIIVSRDWDKTRGESIYWEFYFKTRGENETDPVFARRFKLTLLVHEYLHHAELKATIDPGGFFESVDAWYKDPQWGNPSNDGNFQKFSLFWHLYGGNGSKEGRHSYPGQGEFAYIGSEIALGGIARLQELPGSIIEYYRGVLSEDLLVAAAPSE